MKIRWRDTSLRFRITPTELDLLIGGETLREIARFPGGWSVSVGPGPVTALEAEKPGELTLFLAEGDLAALVETGREGVYFSGDDYDYFVEKDFPCVHPRPAESEESSETFAPPPGFAARHSSG